MECLKCPNFWGNNPNEEKCAQCANTKELMDVVEEMPPLFRKGETIQGYHLKK